MTDDKFIVASEKIDESLKTIPSDYRFAKLPCPDDTSVAEVVALFSNATLTQHQALLSRFDKNARFVLFSFAERMAMLSVRQNSSVLLLEGLVALVMISPMEDAREILIILSIFHNSALKLKVEPEALFRAAVQYADSQAITRLFLDFLYRDAKDKSIAVMGYKEIEGPSGLIYWHFGNKRVPYGLL